MWSGRASDEYQRQGLAGIVGNNYAKGESKVKLKDNLQKTAKK